MVQGISEIAAWCVGFIGLIGAAATTGLPMWKVTAFIEENIIVMETRWEGLWMNCYRQANIRMQCKMYDSLLFLPREMQAARGLMCSSVALSGMGLLAALAGMRCVSCFRRNPRAKTIILMVAGVMQLMACLCVFIPVSWTGHVIIMDFYNPLLLDAQRRELGAALFIGWVTGACFFASAMLFLCRHLPSDKGDFGVYHQANVLGHRAPAREPNVVMYHPISNVSTLRSAPYQPSLQNNGSNRQLTITQQNIPQVMNHVETPINPVYYPDLSENVSLFQGSSLQSCNYVRNFSNPANSMYISQNHVSLPLTYIRSPTGSYQSSFHPVPHSPVIVQYKSSRIQPESDSGSSAVYI